MPRVRRFFDFGRSGDEQGFVAVADELFRASMVVIVVIFFLTAILFAYDLMLEVAARAGVASSGSSTDCDVCRTPNSRERTIA